MRHLDAKEVTEVVRLLWECTSTREQPGECGGDSRRQEVTPTELCVAEGGSWPLRSIYSCTRSMEEQGDHCQRPNSQKLHNGLKETLWLPKPSPQNLVWAICCIGWMQWYSSTCRRGDGLKMLWRTLNIDQWRSGEALIMFDNGSLTTRMSQVNSLDSLSEPALVQWDQGSSWFMTSYD